MKSGAARGRDKAVEKEQLRALVVEDNLLQRTLLSSLLRARGYEVETACDGLDAWEKLSQDPPSIVFTDWMMPNMNGLELVGKIRASDLQRYVYVIICTGKDSHADLIEGMRGGADDFVSKPINADELAVRLSSGERIIRLENRLEEEKSRLEELNRSLSTAYETMRSDLESAAEMQRALLPPPTFIHNVQFEWIFCPAKVVAGDILGFFPLNEHMAGFYQVDVSGHGIPAAMFSVLLTKLLTTTPVSTSLLKTPTSARPGYAVTPPHLAIAEINRRLQGNGDMYFTMVYGMIDVKANRLRFSQAGHPHPIFVPRGGKAVAVGEGGFPVGVLPEMKYDLIDIEAGKGDRIFLASDGVTECTNADGQQFGFEQLTRLIEERREDSLKDLLDNLQQRLRLWRGSHEFQDDLSVVAMEIL